MECCRGVENLELWGSTVKWGSSYRLKSSGECCKACKEMCEAGDSCLCNSWVFCGDKERCGDSFGQVSFEVFSFNFAIIFNCINF